MTTLQLINYPLLALLCHYASRTLTKFSTRVTVQRWIIMGWKWKLAQCKATWSIEEDFLYFVQPFINYHEERNNLATSFIYKSFPSGCIAQVTCSYILKCLFPAQCICIAKMEIYYSLYLPPLLLLHQYKYSQIGKKLQFRSKNQASYGPSGEYH